MGRGGRNGEWSPWLSGLVWRGEFESAKHFCTAGNFTRSLWSKMEEKQEEEEEGGGGGEERGRRRRRRRRRSVVWSGLDY